MYKRRSIAFIYFKAFILIIVLPILGINIIFSSVYKQILVKNASDRTMQTMGQVSLGFENEIKRIELAASTVSTDDEIMELINKWGSTEDANMKFTISKEIDSRLNYVFNYTNEVESIIFFFKNGSMYSYKKFPIVGEYEIKKMSWYQNSLKEAGMVFVTGSSETFINNANDMNILSASVRPNGPGSNNLENIYFAFKTDIIDNFYNNSFFNTTGDIVVVDENNKIMIAKKREFIGKNIRELGISNMSLLSGDNSFIDTVNEKKYFITSHRISGVEWKVVSLEEYSTLTKDINKISLYFFSTISILTILFIIFSVFFLRDILIPIKKLVKRMKMVEKGDFDANVSLYGNNEVSTLGATFNSMVYEIKNLILERDLKERERSKAEIEALQSQINPHFISNTLNSIRLMAMIAKIDNIKNMTEALIKLLNAAFGKNGNLVPIEKEIENLKSYIYIMKVRYGDKFDVTFDVEEGMKNKYIIRLMLQPIVENSILHGISEIEEKGLIAIRGWIEKGKVVFEIKDNGIGMMQEKIEKLFIEDCRNSKGFTGIGIKNVDKRIKLNHGEEYGLKVESVYGEFTKVKIVLPTIESDCEEIGNA